MLQWQLLPQVNCLLHSDKYFTSLCFLGVAACHIGGITLHQFAGIGIAEGTLDHCYKLASRPSVAQNWRKCKHLIIDEISMISAEYFEVEPFLVF